MLGPGLLDLLELDRAHALDFLHPVRVARQDFQRFLAEFLDDPFGQDGPDALDQAAGQKLLDPFSPGREDGNEAVGLELRAELRVDLPPAVDLQPLARRHRRKRPDDDRLFALFDRKLENRVPVLRVIEEDLLDRPFEKFHYVRRLLREISIRAPGLALRAAKAEASLRAISIVPRLPGR